MSDNYHNMKPGQIYQEFDQSFGEKVIRRRINPRTLELEEMVQGVLGNYWAKADSVIRCGYDIVIIDFD